MKLQHTGSSLTSSHIPQVTGNYLSIPLTKLLNQDLEASMHLEHSSSIDRSSERSTERARKERKLTLKTLTHDNDGMMSPCTLARERSRSIVSPSKKKVDFERDTTVINEDTIFGNFFKEEEPDRQSSLERNIMFNQDVINHRKLFQKSNKKMLKKYNFFYAPYVKEIKDDQSKKFKCEMKYPNAYHKANNIHLRRKYAIELIKSNEEKSEMQSQ